MNKVTKQEIYRCADGDSMKGTQFAYKGQVFKIDHIADHVSDVILGLGWTHFASVSRPKGKKAYYANLLIADGQIVNSVVVL